jgi:hypothetical protein
VLSNNSSLSVLCFGLPMSCYGCEPAVLLRAYSLLDAVLRCCTMSYAVLHVSLRYPTPHRDIQKTINQNTSTLQRADAIAEELIFAVSIILLLLLLLLLWYALEVGRLPLLMCV